MVVLSIGQVQGFVRRCQGFGKTPRFGVGSGKRIEDVRLLAARQLVRPEGMLDRLGAVPHRGDRTGRLQPSKIIVGLRRVGLDFQCLAIMRRGFDKLALIDQDGTQVVVRFRVVRVDFNAL